MILELLLKLQGWVAALTAFVAVAVGGSTLVAGTIIATSMGSAMYLLRRMPKTIVYWIDRYCFFTYSLTWHVNVGNTSYQTLDAKFGQHLMNAIFKKVNKKQPYAKIEIVNTVLSETVHPGRFWFMHEGMLVHGTYTMSDKKDNGDLNMVTSAIKLKTFKLLRGKLYEFIANCSPATSTPGIHSISMLNPYNSYVVRYRSLTSAPDIELDPELKNEIDTEIHNWLSQREYRNKNNISHKLTFMFFGEPGNGKSTLGEYISWKLNSSLFVVRVSEHGFSGPDIGMYIEGCRNNIPIGAIPVLLADDFDTYWQGISPRTTLQEELEAESKASGVELAKLNPYQRNQAQKRTEYSSRNLGLILASLQSSISINDAVVIFNTNHLEKLDSAIYRPGRITLLREVGPMKAESIMRHFKNTYNADWPSWANCLEWRACDVSSFIDKADGDALRFIELVCDPNSEKGEVLQLQTATKTA